MYGYRWTVVEYVIVYAISVSMSCLGDSEVVGNGASFLQKMMDYRNPAVFILWALAVFAVLYWALMGILAYYSRKQNFSAAFYDIMLAHSEAVGWQSPSILGGISWGKDKSLWMAPNIVLGMDPEDVAITHFDPTEYEFPDELKTAFTDFEESEYLKQIQRLGNDLPRYMLTRYGSNFDNDHPMLTIQLRQTHWRHCQFVWRGKMCDDKEWRDKIIGEHLNSGLRVARYPNSLCLHLIIETPAGNVLITEISTEKSNDYPSTKAVSLGEQIEMSDFLTQKDFESDFVTVWTRRAICEEFGISTDQYEKEFDEKSLRVLSLDFEMDIYNFALVCTIKMRHSCDYFKKVVNTTIEQKEISDMTELSLSEIPAILILYPKNAGEYHPSSFLRLLLFYLYKNGYKRTCRQVCLA